MARKREKKAVSQPSATTQNLTPKQVAFLTAYREFGSVSRAAKMEAMMQHSESTRREVERLRFLLEARPCLVSQQRDHQA